MAHVVLFRAANVGGRNVFRPALFAKQLAPLDVASVGAAGTFLVRGKASPAAIRRAMLAHLDFEPEMIIRPAGELAALVRSRPFAGASFSKDVRGWIAALSAEPEREPKLPVLAPAGRSWSVRVDRVDGAFAIGCWRRRSVGFVFPNEVVERALGVRATTRWLETFEKLAELCGST